MTHYLKTWPEYFQAVKDGSKTFELRKNDRNYQVGDELVLEEFEPRTERYMGVAVCCKVTYVSDCKPWLPDGYVVMSIEKIGGGAR